MKALSRTVSALPVSAALSIDLAAKAQIAAGRDVISFCVGEPDFGTPMPICRAGIDAITAGDTRYTNASGSPALKAAIAASLLRDDGLSYRVSELAVTTGAKYAVYAAVLALTDPDDEVILPAPYWTSYHHIITLARAVPVVIPCCAENGWKMTPEQLHQAVTGRTKALILNNPNNPTGAVYTRGELEKLAAVIRSRDLYVIADEIYSRLLYTGESFCPAASVDDDMRARTVLVGGVSKTYAMTGWRIGYAAGGEAVIRAISALLSHTTGSPSAIGQAAAIEALLGPQAAVERMRQTYQKRRDRLMEELNEVPFVRCTAPQGAFYALLDIRTMLDGGSYADAAAFARALLESEDVAAVPCDDYGAPGHLRLSFTLPEERMAEGIRRMKRFVGRIGGTHVSQ